MKFIFDDSFSTDPNLFKSQTDERSVFVSGNLIFESQRISAAPAGAVEAAIRKYKTSIPKDRTQLRNDIASRSGIYSSWDDADVEAFDSGVVGSSSSGTSRSSREKSKTRQFIDTIKEDAEILGEASDQSMAQLTLRSRLVDQLKPFMSESEIGKLFDDAIFKIGMPESELLDFIKNILDYSSTAGANIKNLFAFALMHFSTRLDKATTELILETAAKLQEKYPELDFFKMLIDSARGDKPKLGLLAIIKDKDDMYLAKKIFSLAQYTLAEQNEAVNRERKEVRMRLQSMQERKNLQRALFNALKMNEVDRALTTEIDKFGDLFRKLITSPQFRALKDLQYTLLAGRRLLDTWMTLYADTQPINARLSPTETRDDQKSVGRFTGDAQNQSTSRFPSRRENFLASSNPKFIRIAQNQQATNEQEVLKTQAFAINRLYQGISNNVLPRIQSSNLPPQIKNFMNLYLNTHLQELQKASRSNSRISFSDLGVSIQNKVMMSIDKLNQGTQNLQQNNRRQSAFESRFIYAQMSGAQTSRPQVDNNIAQVSGHIDNIVNFLVTLAKFETFGKLISRENVFDFILLLRFVGRAEQNILMELDLQLGNIGRFAPADANIFKDGQLTKRGAEIIANREEVNALLEFMPELSARARDLETNIEEDKKFINQVEQNLSVEANQSVQTFQGSEADDAPMEFPAELKEKYEKFVDVIQGTINDYYVLLGIRRQMNKVAQVEKPDSNIISVLNRLEQQILVEVKQLEEKKAKYQSTNLIRVELERKRRLMQLLGPIEKTIQAYSNAGISIANLVTQPNGLLNLLRRIREEEENALEKLLDEYALLKEDITPVNLGTFKKPMDREQNTGTEIGEPGKVTEDMV